jgi:hypothetical protein
MWHPDVVKYGIGRPPAKYKYFLCGIWYFKGPKEHQPWQKVRCNEMKWNIYCILPRHPPRWWTYTWDRPVLVATYCAVGKPKAMWPACCRVLMSHVTIFLIEWVIVVLGGRTTPTRLSSKHWPWALSPTHCQFTTDPMVTIGLFYLHES